MSNGLTPNPDSTVEIKDLPTQDSPAGSAFIAIQQGGETYKINLGSFPIANILPDATSTSKGVVSAGDGLSAQDGRLSVSGDFLEGTGNQAIEGSLVVTNTNGYATKLDGYLLWMDGKRVMFAYHGPQSGDRHILHFNYEKDFDEVNFQGRVAFGQADVEVNGSLIYNGSEVLTKDSTVQKLALDVVGSDQLQQSSVGTSAIADGAVTGGKIEKASVTSDNLRGNIAGSKLADGSIGGRKITDGSIDGSKIQEFAIGGNLLSPGGVGEGAIAEGAVTPSKIPDSSLETTKLTPEAIAELTRVLPHTVGTSNLQDQSVTEGKIAKGAVSESKIAENAVTADKLTSNAIDPSVATLFPELYQRGGGWTFPARTTVATPEQVTVNVGGIVLRSSSDALDLDNANSWDTTSGTDYTSAANRKGEDFFVYAVQPAAGFEAEFVVSANATIPDGYTADNSRKIGGFHCLCADVGTIADHSLSGYSAGDVLPASLWDLTHRADCATNEGMVYDPRSRKWVDIYLPSWDGDTMRSLYDAVIADGASSPSFQWYNFVELFGQVGKQMTSQEEFMCYSRGSNQQTNIKGGSDPGKTGGHVDENGRRMISDIGVEDCCGALFQWAREAAAETDQGSSLVQQSAGTYDSQNNIARGQGYEVPNRPLLGGNWSSATLCGSRGSRWGCSPLFSYSGFSSRGVAEPRRSL